MAKYVNKMNGATMMTDGVIDDKTKTLAITKEDGTEQRIASSTFKRWWKKVEDITETEVPVETDTVVENVENSVENVVTTEECVPVTVEETKPTETEVKPKKKPTVKPNPEVIDNIINYVMDTAVAAGATVFVPAKEIKMRSLKINGHMFMAFNFSSKSVVLRCRGAVTKDVAAPTRTVNHMFDYNYVVTEFNENVKELIDKLIKVSMDHQIQKNTNSNAKKTNKNKEEN